MYAVHVNRHDLGSLSPTHVQLSAKVSEECESWLVKCGIVIVDGVRQIVCYVGVLDSDRDDEAAVCEGGLRVGCGEYGLRVTT